MAKGDSGEMQDLINQQQRQSQGTIDYNRDWTNMQNATMFSNYAPAARQNTADYNNIMNAYSQFLGGGNTNLARPNPGPTIGVTDPRTRVMLPGSSTIDPNTGAPVTIGAGGSTDSGSPRTPGRFNTTSTGSRVSPGLAGNAGPSGSTQDFGDLNNASSWMNLVNNDQQLDAWVGQWIKDPQLRAYYVGKIKGQPGANAAEQAGSASYWANKIQQDPSLTGVNPTGGPNTGGDFSAIGGWQNAAQTGLLTDQQKADLRARAIAPIRAAYQTAANNVDTQRGIAGGYSPNYTATQAKLAREQGYGMSDAETNANAAIVAMQQQGQLAGLQGLTGAQLGALAGATGAYGANPGLAGTFGNQALGANQQALGGSALQNQLAQILFGAKLGQSQIPSNYQQALGNINSTIGTIGNAYTLGAFG